MQQLPKGCFAMSFREQLHPKTQYTMTLDDVKVAIICAEDVL